MAKRSAGLIMYRWRESHLEVFLVHPGGPLWASKDKGAWSIPKGEYTDGEEPFEAAKRELFEETGFAPEGKFLKLGSITQSGGKIVIARPEEIAKDANRFADSLISHLGRAISTKERHRRGNPRQRLRLDFRAASSQCWREGNDRCFGACIESHSRDFLRSKGPPRRNSTAGRRFLVGNQSR
jgi:hypothetical protein